MTTKYLTINGKGPGYLHLSQKQHPKFLFKYSKTLNFIRIFELNENLIEESTDDDSSRSDSNPSDDDISASELMKLLIP